MKKLLIVVVTVIGWLLNLAAGLAIGAAGLASAETIRVIRCNPSQTECYYVDVPVRPQNEWDRLQELTDKLRQLQDDYERTKQRNIDREIYGR